MQTGRFNLPSNHHRLAELVFKYFGAEIREALLEVQGSLAETNIKPREQLTNGKQVGK